MALLEIKNISFTYALDNVASLNNISFDIEEGEFVVISGSTGSGKSTLLKMIKKEIRPKGSFSGNIFFEGRNIEELSLRESVGGFGYVLQNPHAQIVNEKVYSELGFGLENLGVSTEEIGVRVAEIANYFGINNWYNQNTSSLSGGEKQILNLASILIMKPKVLLIDEPTSNLDPIAASEFIATIKKINQDFGITILMVEHRLDELFVVADRVIVLDEGKIIADAEPSKVAKFINDERLYLNLPTLLRISKRLKLDTYPLTVKDGKKILKRYKSDIKYKAIPKFNYIEEVVKLKGVYFKYDRDSDDILEDTELSVYQKEIFTIVGSNGSGKSTLLKVIAGLQTPYYGKVYLNHKNIKKIKDSNLYYKNIAYLPQDPSDIMFTMSVREELGYDKITNQNTLDFFKKLEIEKLLDKHPDDLSGGEVQKVAIAKILLQEPKILLLDEPTKGLDTYLKQNLIDIIKELRDNNITIIIVSHDIEFAAKISSRVGLLFRGKILSINDPNTFFSNNYFYSTITNKIARDKFPNVVTEDDLIELVELNGVI